MMVELLQRIYLRFIMFCCKAYVRGYEFEKLGTTFKDLNKARDVTIINAELQT